MNVPTANKQIIFVDSSVQDYQSLIQGIDPAQIVILNENFSAIDQITNALADQKDIEAVHIVSHGSEGSLKLGADVLNGNDLENFSAQIKQWGNALTANGDILLYGCDVAAGEVGATFVKRLSEITGADVAASTDKTGNAALGGDWALEVNIGNIETPIAFQTQGAQKYDGVLATFTVTNTNDSGAGSLREAIAQANTQTGADTIIFDPSVFNTSQTIRLNSQLIVDDSVSIQGTGLNLVKISGDANNNGINDNGDVRLFFVNQGTVSFSDLTLQGGRGQGGNGAAGGGGGLGAGGALFINGNGTSLPAQVTINNVTFTQNQAVGGQGGASNGLGGGGGFGGAGGSGGYQPGGGGGGGGFSDIGTNGTTGGGTGGGSSFFGNTGGTGGTTSNSGVASNGGFGGGGGGGLSAFNANGTNGGQGGDFGGGGAGGASQFSGVSGQGGSGGFGGGGGNAGVAANGSTYGLGGNGGFGGGGGSGNTGGGLGGSFGGNGYDAGGGGGAGLGGAIFLRNGSLMLTNVTFNNNSATGGSGGFSAQPGQGKSGAIFVNAGATVTASGVTYSSNSATNASTTATDNSNTYGTITLLDTTAPTATSFTPADNATNIAVAADLVVTLSEAVQKGTGNIVIKKVSDNSVVETIDVTSANVTVTGSSVTINPTANLVEGTDYYVEIAAGAIKDLAGNNYAGLVDPTAWNFTTVADTTAPTATSFTPADNATNIAVAADLVVTLSEAVQKGTGNIVIKKVSDNSVVETIDVTSANVTVTGSSVTINPTANLVEGTDYYVEIAAGAIKDLAGNNYAGLVDPTAWNFTTVADTTAPTATSFTPADNATNIAVAADLVVNLNEAVQKGTGNIVIKKVSDNSVVETIDVTSANVTVTGSSVTINPTANLVEGTDYYVEIAAGAIKDLAGNNYAGTTGAATWNFTTVADTTPPTAASFTPADNATNIAVAADLAVTLSEAVQKGTGNIVIKKVSDNSVVETIDVTSANVTVSGSTVTINPTADLAPSTEYYVEIASGAIKDSAGNNYAGITGPTSWNFTTLTASTLPIPPIPQLTQNGSANTNHQGQSFTASENGTISEIAVYTGGAFTGNLLIYNSSNGSGAGGNKGTPTYQQSISLPSGMGWKTVKLDTPYSATSGQTYSVIFEGTGTFSFSNTNPYGGGNYIFNYGNANASNDLAFFINPPEIDLKGNGTSIANQDITPTTIDGTAFADTPVGSPLVRTFSIENLGSSNLTLSGTPVVTITGANASDFTVKTLPANTISASQATPFEITFQPSAIGTRTARINISSNDLDESTYTFTIQGNGLDGTAPTASSFTPADNATSVAVAADLVVTLSESVQKGIGNIVIKKVSDNSVVETIDVTSANVTVTGSTVTVNPTADLAQGTDYYVEIAAGAIKNLGGNNYAGITGATAWNFTTAAAVDTTAPTATFTPADNATSVAVAAD
ncbi:Ig-like domain-containing protein, partial [Microcoleus sp. M2_D4]